MGALKTAKNPQAMLENMANQNPQIKEIMDYIKSNGNDPKAAFYQRAKEMGVDPEEIINMLK